MGDVFGFWVEVNVFDLRHMIEDYDLDSKRRGQGTPPINNSTGSDTTVTFQCSDTVVMSC